MIASQGNLGQEWFRSLKVAAQSTLATAKEIRIQIQDTNIRHKTIKINMTSLTAFGKTKWMLFYIIIIKIENQEK